jgi:hypothetical protein
MSAKKTEEKMTSKPFSLPDGIEIYFSANLTPDQRELVEQSIATVVGRTRAEADATLARMAEEDMLLDAINAPVAKLIRADPRAAEALEKLSVRRDGAEDSLHPEGPLRGGHDHVIPVSPTDRSVELRFPPYDFAWSWHHNGGAPPFSQIGNTGGRLGVDARSGGLVTGGADRVVHAHIGVGCIVRTDLPIVVELSATRSSRHSFLMGAPGLGASATSEGGLETTLMRGGQVEMAGTLPLWRRRLTSGEARDRTNFARGVYPDGMGGRIEPGEYAFNVGIYAVADHSSGIGGAGVQSLVQSNILEMRINRR